MVSRIFKGAATLVATLSLAGAASANCSSGMYCGDAAANTMSNWSGQAGTSYNVNSPNSLQSYSAMNSQQADSTYATGSISQTYSDSSTYSFSGSTASVPGLGHNESLQATNCPVNVYGTGEGTVLGCYNVVKPVPQTTYYRVVRPVIYVRYPVPVAVPYASPCNTVTHYSRYGDFGHRAPRRGCR